MKRIERRLDPITTIFHRSQVMTGTDDKFRRIIEDIAMISKQVIIDIVFVAR